MNVAPSNLSQRNIALSTLLALNDAEAALMPNGSHSRLYVAVQTANTTVRFLSNPTFTARTALAKSVEDAKTVESNAVALNQLPVGSLVQRGLSVAIHVAQAALAGCDVPPEHVLEEARWILLAAASIAETT